MPLLLAASAALAGGPCADKQVLLSEVLLTPEDGQVIEIHNPTDREIDLSDVYLTDATFAKGGEYYYKITTGRDAGGGGFGDFHARFPEGATIEPGAYQTLALAGSTAFRRRYGRNPTYELYEDAMRADEVPDMREAFVGSIGRQGRLDPQGEVLVLYCWDGSSDLVTDLDYVLWGLLRREAVDKTGVTIHRPPSRPVRYPADTPIEEQAVLGVEPPPLGDSWQRVDMDEGQEVKSGGSGISGHVETSEDLHRTWTVAPATPGGPREGLDIVTVHLEVAPQGEIPRGGAVLYVLRAHNTSEVGREAVELGLQLPPGVSFERWLAAPDATTDPDEQGVFWRGNLDPEARQDWILLARADAARGEGDAPRTATAFALRDTHRAEATATFTPASSRVELLDPMQSEPDMFELPAEKALQSRGQVGVFGRGFLNDNNPATQDYNLGLEGRFQLDLVHKPLRERVRIYGLVDREDPDRSALIVEEAYVEWRSAQVRLRAGAVTLNTSRLDAFHPADVINARFFDSEIENPSKIGEPMAAVRVQIPFGAAYAYFMPYRTAPRLPSPRSRMGNLPPDLEMGPPIFIDRSGRVSESRFDAQWAVNLEQTYGPVDLAIHYVRHTDRWQPLVVLDPDEETLRMVLLPVSHLGGTYNHAIGSTVLKAEWAWRRFATPSATDGPLSTLPNRDHVAIAGGMEYAFGLWRHTLTALVEAQTIVLEGPDNPVLRSQISPFQRDVLGGLRYAFNDKSDRSITVVGIADVERGNEFFGAIRYSQRIDEEWTLAASLRGAFAPAPGPNDPVSGLQGIRDAKFATVLLTRHF